MKKLLAILAIFCGSFIAFALEPLIGRTLLPSFGGSAAVWVTCLASFQLLMVAGYWYADTARRHIKTHLTLLALASAWCLAVAFTRGKVLDLISTTTPSNSINVLISVVVMIGVSFILLSSNSTLVSTVSGGDYRLYAWSNLGSLLGLLAYPFLFEPRVSLTAQWSLAAGCILLYAILLSLLLKGSGVSTTQQAARSSTTSTSSFSSPLYWFLLSGISCFLLNAITAHLTLDVMPMPFVWVLTLALFIVSYIIGFSGRSGMRLTAVFMFATLILGIGLASLNVAKIYRSVNFIVILSVCSAFLLTACSFIHSWLYATRPQESALPRYYLAIAIGGAVGGAVASIGFPLASKSIVEYPIALAATGVLSIIWALQKGWMLRISAIVLVVAGCIVYSVNSHQDKRPSVAKERGFYGVVEVLESKARVKAGEGVLREFIHGTTVHGMQALVPGRDRMPTAYYTPNGCGYAILAHPKYCSGEPMRVCLVGLGLGVSYAYARPGDYYRGYEISPEALNIATNQNLFTFVSGCPAKHEELLMDGRKGLEGEVASGEEPYDVIILDAFSGDSQPYHLSTIEAFALYFSRLRQDGVLCVNISNWHMDLAPFMKSVGDAFDCPLLGLSCGNDYAQLQFATRVAFFCRDPSGLGAPPAGIGMIDFGRIKAMDELPTDEKGSFVSLINW